MTEEFFVVNSRNYSVNSHSNALDPVILSVAEGSRRASTARNLPRLGKVAVPKALTNEVNLTIQREAHILTLS
jgi:hypothetical protein